MVTLLIKVHTSFVKQKFSLLAKPCLAHSFFMKFTYFYVIEIAKKTDVFFAILFKKGIENGK